ncbi:hypothetical protein F4818DRAFT_454211 [Hypoxylon cercidicola]|nr:hypothetical protein F4818DRAFT_454211 [Hypoxylon cercidicola]
MTNDWYGLTAVVRVGSQDPGGGAVESDIRLYHLHRGDFIIPYASCHPEFQRMAKEKLNCDYDWRVGDRRYKFILFYCRIPQVERRRADTPPPPSRTMGEVVPPELEQDFPFFLLK